MGANQTRSLPSSQDWTSCRDPSPSLHPAVVPFGSASAPVSQTGAGSDIPSLLSWLCSIFLATLSPLDFQPLKRGMYLVRTESSGKNGMIKIHGSIRTTEILFPDLIFGVWRRYRGIWSQNWWQGYILVIQRRELSISCWFPHFNYNSYQVFFQHFQSWFLDSCSITTKGMDFSCGCL